MNEVSNWFKNAFQATQGHAQKFLMPGDILVQTLSYYYIVWRKRKLLQLTEKIASLRADCKQKTSKEPRKYEGVRGMQMRNAPKIHTLIDTF